MLQRKRYFGKKYKEIIRLVMFKIFNIGSSCKTYVLSDRVDFLFNISLTKFTLWSDRFFGLQRRTDSSLIFSSDTEEVVHTLNKVITVDIE